ncbi:hypothetical protein BC830DRAFT_1100787, partial [Chytriomyces sp. MP71]
MTSSVKSFFSVYTAFIHILKCVQLSYGESIIVVRVTWNTFLTALCLNGFFPVCCFSVLVGTNADQL